MNKLSCVFLCGDRSPYGLAHLESIAEHFDLKMILVADEKRWIYFREMLSGQTQDRGKFSALEIYRRIKSALFFRKAIAEHKHKTLLKSFNVRVIAFNDVNSDNAIELIKDVSPQIILSAAYPQIFSKRLLEAAPMGAVNFHPSLLPRFRGAHPHYWCISEGANQGGATAHFMTERIDDGDIIAQQSIDISMLYYQDLYRELIRMSPSLVMKVSNFLQNSESKALPQNERNATLFRNDRDIHHRLDFQQMNQKRLHNKIRAGQAYFFQRGIKFIIDLAELKSKNRNCTNNIQPTAGIIVDIDASGIVVFTNDNLFLKILQISHDGKSRTAFEWAKQFSINIGEVLN